MGLDDIAISNGSACTSASIEPSHVLIAHGLSETEAFSCLRFSLGRFNGVEEVSGVVGKVRLVVEGLRAMVG